MTHEQTSGGGGGGEGAGSPIIRKVGMLNVHLGN